MNTEITKAMNKKENSFFQRVQKWYRKNGYKINRVILFPVWIGIVAKDKIHNYWYKNTEWSDERANEILSYYIPRVAKWYPEEKEFYLFDNGCGWDKRKIKLKDRMFWRKFTGFWGGEMREYLIDKFELDGFEKTVNDTYDSRTEITFTLKEGK